MHNSSLNNLAPILMILSRVSNPPKTGFNWESDYILKHWIHFKWNQPYLSRVSNLSRDSNSIISASDYKGDFMKSINNSISVQIND